VVLAFIAANDDLTVVGADDDVAGLL